STATLSRMRRVAAVLTGALALAASGCGHGGSGGSGATGGTPTGPATIGQPGTSTQAAKALGFPDVATKNTTRVGGADAVADAAAVAVAVYPGATPQSRPPAVALVDKSDWRAALAASALMGAPIRAPLLLADGNELP